MTKKKICCTADTHGFLPKIPECDIFIHAGDICPCTNHDINFQRKWLNISFRRWLNKIPAKHKIFIAGNHDLIFEDQPQMIPDDLSWTYLQDSGIEIEGLKFYGSPWTLFFNDWSFNSPPHDPLKRLFMQEKWKVIPHNTDIFITHGPAQGYGDLVQDDSGRYEHVGDSDLLRKIYEIKPKLHLFGHIHSQHGIYNFNDVIMINASYINEEYKPTYKIIELEISDDKTVTPVVV